MSLRVHLTPKSRNAKTGPIPVSTTSADSCPPSCPLKNAGCYANGGPLAIHWRAVTEGRRGTDWKTFCDRVAALPDGQIWRHNQCGDLPGSDGQINAPLLRKLVTANKGKKGFTYTHYKPSGANARVIELANQDGFTINLSADNVSQADAMADLDIAPVVTLLSLVSPARSTTPAGRKVISCPAQHRDGVNCASCRLCANVDRRVIIGLEVHGSQRRRAQRLCGE